ncbi:MAG: aminoglycoside phosphotransferase family protein [Chloroflexota bacterium]
MIADNSLMKVLYQFDLNAEPTQLEGGSQATFRVGDVVLKQVKETSLENNHSPKLMVWIAQFSQEIIQQGFRIPKPIAMSNGDLINEDGWTAWTFLAGRHAQLDQVPQCITAILDFHKALKNIANHPLMDDNRTPWGKAHQWCWGDKPDFVQPKLQDWVNRLYSLRKPISGLKSQLIHGDLNPENILVAPDLPPAFIDFSPFWAPPEFAVAIFANFIGPRQGDISVLKDFSEIKHFDQLLIRASIRMLLVMSELDALDDWENCSEKKAAEMVIDYVSG